MGTEPQHALPSGQNALSAKGFAEAYAALFAEIQSEWNKAEAAIKRSEHIAIDVTIPAVKELRYAGRRIVDAIALAGSDGNPDDKIKALLEDARFCCHRAQHDAIDAALAKIAIDLDNLTTRIGFDAVVKAYPPFQQFYATFSIAQEHVASSRHRREDRNAIYDTISSVDLPEMIRCYREIMVMRPIAKSYARQAWLGSVNGFVLTVIFVVTMVCAAMAVDWQKWLAHAPLASNPVAVSH